MRRAVYLDFSISLFEKDSNLKAFSNHLKDLSRYISKTKNVKFYVSLTLEFVTTFKDDLKDLLEAINTLKKDDRVEFVVRDSFSIDSLSLPRNVSEFNFIMNEYLIGYYFGDKRNFEGDPSIMVKNLTAVMPFSGSLTESDISFLESMGYSNFFIDKNYLGSSSYIYKSSIFVEVDFDFTKLFANFVDKETLDKYLLGSISNNFMVYHVNPYKLFLENSESFNINVSNLFHLIDLTDKIEYRFADEYFEMPVIKENKLLSFSNNSTEDDLHRCQARLSQFLKLNLPENFDLSIFEDLRTVSLWEATGNKLIDEYLRTSFLLLTLLSSSINDKINLLNRHLIAHLSEILNEVEVYSNKNSEFKKVTEEYRSYLNQKLSN